jgi:hypothetical protein
LHPPSLLPSETILPRCRRVKLLGLTPTSIPAACIKPPRVDAVLVTATGLHWVIQLRGGVEAMIEYDARRPGVELVKVDHRVVCREGTLRGYNSRFSFTLPGHPMPTPVELEVRNSLWSAVTEFRIILAGETVFACRTDVETCSLPLPVEAPSMEPSELPLPHRP